MVVHYIVQFVYFNPENIKLSLHRSQYYDHVYMEVPYALRNMIESKAVKELRYQEKDIFV